MKRIRFIDCFLDRDRIDSSLSRGRLLCVSVLNGSGIFTSWMVVVPVLSFIVSIIVAVVSMPPSFGPIVIPPPAPLTVNSVDGTDVDDSLDAATLTFDQNVSLVWSVISCVVSQNAKAWQCVWFTRERNKICIKITFDRLNIGCQCLICLGTTQLSLIFTEHSSIVCLFSH